MPVHVISNKIPGEQRIALLEGNMLHEISIIDDADGHMLGNIYCGIIKRTLPGMDAAFVDFGGNRSGFLYIKDLPESICCKVKNNEEKPDISKLLNGGQKVMVQVEKEPIGEKGARLSCNISIPGRYAVLMPLSPGSTGVSKKIENPQKRTALKNLGVKICGKKYGIIFRTLSENENEKTLEKEIRLLIKKWKNIETEYKSRKSPCLLLKNDGPLIRILSDIPGHEIEKIIVDSQEDFERTALYVKKYMPGRKELLLHYDKPYPVFDYYGVEQEISKITEKKIWLKNGGFLYIEQTEALTVIDVNTGKYLGKNSFEQTAFQTNMAAVEEICYHIRLRDIGGIIVIDFIDLKEHEDRSKIISHLKNTLKKDKAKSSVYHFTKLGLIQITRKRTSESNIRRMTEVCPYCNGKGNIKSKEIICSEIFREIKRTVMINNSFKISVKAHPDIILSLKNEKIGPLKVIEEDLNIDIILEADSAFHMEHFAVND